MLGWGACGAVGALLSPFLRNRWVLAAVAAVLGFAFSASMDVWLWWGFSPHTFPALAAVLGRGLWFDASHAIGNVRDRARRRAGAAADARPLRRAPADGGRVGLADARSPRSRSRCRRSRSCSRTTRTARSRRRAARPTRSLTSWAVLGLRAAGADAPGSLAYLQAQEPTLQTANDIALVALARAGARRAAGRAARASACEGASERPDRRDAQLDVLGRARARPLDRRRRRASSWRSRRRAAASRGTCTASPTRTTRRRRSRRCASRACTARRSRARCASCARSRTRDGGFELTHGRGSDAQSTAWAIQGLVAAGRTPPRSAFAYLARLKRADGSYRYSARYAATPVWVTAQVLAALAKKPFP